MADKYTIGKLSKISGISTRTIRFYGEIGLLNYSTDHNTNYRYYCEEDIKKLEQILLFKSLGFSLDDIKAILSSDNNETVDSIFKARSDDFEAKISELSHYKEALMAIRRTYTSSGLNYINNHYLIKEMSYMNNTFINTFSKLDTDLQIKLITELYYTGSLSAETLKIIGPKPGSRILNELHMTIIKAILNKVDRNTEKKLIERLEKSDTGLSEEIKSALFTFDDIVMLSDKVIAKWLNKCEDSDLIIALKGSGRYVKARILSNLTSGRLDLIKNSLYESKEYTLDESYSSMKKLIEILKAMDISDEIR